MKTFYSDEKNTQIVISLLKQHDVKKVIASPGSTNICFLASIQQDPWFEIYSAVDERSAAYIACGLSFESGEPVVINCTGASSSRNYMPGLTEAYYRKLPIIAITSSQISSKIGHLVAQVTDRTNPPFDTAKYSATVPFVKDEDDIWDCEVKVNNALLECRRAGGGPVHLNLETKYSRNFNIQELPTYRKIDRITLTDKFPTLPKGKIAIFIGAHAKMSNEQITAIDNFCINNNAVAFCDLTSNYKSKYALNFSLVSGQHYTNKTKFTPDLLIHIGEISGDYYNLGMCKSAKNVWRINEDGEIRDTFRKLTYVFEMPIANFFNHYSTPNVKDNSYYTACNNELIRLRSLIPEVPFSNLWIANKIAHLIPENSTLHLGILNSLRAWNMFEIPKNVNSMSNVGAFGIDGCTSTLIGASLYNKKQLHYLIIGDLAFFYDLNVIGNRHIGNNVRILLVNNGGGIEFKNHGIHNLTKEDINLYIAASGHHGDKSPNLIKNYAENLGYEYLTASNKEEFNAVYERFISPSLTDKSMIFEVFISDEDERNALTTISNIANEIAEQEHGIVHEIKRFVWKNLGDKTTKTIQRIRKR
ncbi:MAG: thiamine pyrophosphate-binding protein [bacterium]